MIKSLKILWRQGKQYIPDTGGVSLPAPFRGRPEISSVSVDEAALSAICPAGAISAGPVSIDLGKCVFCGECALRYPEKVKFTQDYRLSSNVRDALVVGEGDTHPIELDPNLVREEIRSMFSGSLKLRQVSAGGDNSAEWELNAAGNVNFDMGRYGVEFVASPRHADGIVITGPISENMAAPLKTCYEAIPRPKIIILCGADAISGGIFAGSPALDRSFLKDHDIDLYVPGAPPHPLTFINGILELIRRK
ncbi:MAG: NADH:ubiquinone oxidoreductase [Chloroflexota bacterium]